MAGVTINIPNIGNISADNAATEDTLQKILQAIQKSGGASGGTKPGNSKEEKDLKKVREDEAKQLKKDLEETKKAGTEQTKTNKHLAAFGNYLKGVGSGMSTGFGQITSASVGLAKTFALTATTVATAFMTSYDAMAKDPIGAASTMMATQIDVYASVAKAAVDVFAGGIKAAGGVLGPWSQTASGAADALSSAAKAAIDFAAAVLKVANQVFATEFKKSVDALNSYAKAGASFAGGMTEMRNTANRAGLSLEVLNKSTLASAESIRASGLTMGEGAGMVAKGMDAARKTIGKSGMTMRDEMLALGFNYEEQGEIVASLGAQMKASGQDIRNLAPADLAKQTKEYATNLKVMSDITGQDAKKLMEKARSESMRGALMNKLDKDQRDNFTKAHTMLAKYGPEVQNALIQQIAGGTITDAKVAANADLVQMIQDIAGNVQQAGGDIVESTGQAMGDARKRLESSSVAGATDMAAALGSSGLPAAMAGITNNILASGFTPEMAKTSKDAAVAMSENMDSAAKNYAKITSEASDFAVKMETLVGENLGTYSKMLADTYSKTSEMMTKVVEGVDQLLKVAKGEGLEGLNENSQDTKIEKNLQGFWENFEHYSARAVEKTGDGIAGALKMAGAETLGGWVGKLTDSAKDERRKNETDYMKKEGRTGFALGGIASGPTSGFETLLHGTEAVVPLPDGKSIPIDMSGTISQLVASTQGNSQQAAVAYTESMKMLSDKLDSMIAAMSHKDTSANSVFAEVASHLGELKETALKQLDAHDIMKRTLADSKDNLSGILNNIM
jgi:hypothetical protein